MVVSTKKKKKAKKWRGYSRHGHGARKKWKKSGHHGGCGMAGTGKRADHKKSLIIKLYGNNYFGKQGITSRSSAKKINDTLNVGEIQREYLSLMKKHGKNNELVLERYKILGEGEIKDKITIKARAFSNSAKEKIEKAGGKIIIVDKKKKIESVEKPKTETPKKQPEKKSKQTKK
jgi:large subunit ribosomal protein L15